MTASIAAPASSPAKLLGLMPDFDLFGVGVAIGSVLVLVVDAEEVGWELLAVVDESTVELSVLAACPSPMLFVAV